MTEDTIGKATMLTSEERTTDFMNLMDRWDTLTIGDAEWIVANGVFTDAKLALLKQIDEARTHGILAANKLTGMRIRLLEEVPKSFRTADKFGLTALGAMVFKRHDNLPVWAIFNPMILTANLKKGNFAWIAGQSGEAIKKVGIGKTNIACVMMEQWYAEGNIVIANIKPMKPDPRWFYVINDKELIKAVAQVPTDKQWCFWLDEGGLVYSKGTASERRSKFLDQLMRALRKLDGSMVYIDQRPESVPTILQDFATSRITAHKIGVATFDLRGPEVWYETTVRAFPKTNLPYDTDDIAYFALSEKSRQLFAALTGSLDVKQSLKQFAESI